jgi:hypothetical protein
VHADRSFGLFHGTLLLSLAETSVGILPLAGISVMHFRWVQYTSLRSAGRNFRQAGSERSCDWQFKRLILHEERSFADGTVPHGCRKVRACTKSRPTGYCHVIQLMTTAAATISW